MNTGDTIFKNTFYFKKKKAFCPLLTRSEIAVLKFPPQPINRPNDHKIEKLNLNLFKSIFGVGSKASNLAVVGDLHIQKLMVLSS
jgi:hypothetical protein